MGLDGKLSDEFILEKMNEANITDKPQFTLHNIIGWRAIEYRKIKNPKEYDLERKGPNPEYFKVMIYENDFFLLTERQGMQDEVVYHSYLYNGSETLYSNELHD